MAVEGRRVQSRENSLISECEGMGCVCDHRELRALTRHISRHAYFGT